MHAISRVCSDHRVRNHLVLKRDPISEGGVAVVGASPVLQHALCVPAAHDAEPRVVLHRHYRVAGVTSDVQVREGSSSFARMARDSQQLPKGGLS